MMVDAAAKSDVYQKMIKAVRGDHDLSDPVVQEINCNKNEFSIDDSQGGELIYRGNLIVPPPEIRPELIRLAHAAHQGEDAMWRTCRSIWYWGALTRRESLNGA